MKGMLWESTILARIKPACLDWSTLLRIYRWEGCLLPYLLQSWSWYILPSPIHPYVPTTLLDQGLPENWSCLPLLLYLLLAIFRMTLFRNYVALLPLLRRKNRYVLLLLRILRRFSGMEKGVVLDFPLLSLSHILRKLRNKAAAYRYKLRKDRNKLA